MSIFTSSKERQEFKRFQEEYRAFKALQARESKSQPKKEEKSKVLKKANPSQKDRVLDVLRAANRPMAVKEISAQLSDVPVGSLHTVLASLAKAGTIYRPQGKKGVYDIKGASL